MTRNELCRFFESIWQKAKETQGKDTGHGRGRRWYHWRMWMEVGSSMCAVNIQKAVLPVHRRSSFFSLLSPLRTLQRRGLDPAGQVHSTKWTPADFGGCREQEKLRRETVCLHVDCIWAKEDKLLALLPLLLQHPKTLTSYHGACAIWNSARVPSRADGAERHLGNSSEE